MEELEALHDPWLIAVWPGMGNVALAAGSYLVEQLDAEPIGELPAREFFEVQHVDVEGGIATAGRMPRNLLFLWRDPQEQHDLIILIGEAQPNSGGHQLARKLLDYAVHWGVSRCFTFAAMATQLHPASTPRVFGAATGQPLLDELEPAQVELLSDGQISGMNGILLAAAAEQRMHAVCLLGELPYFAVGVPNPRASQAVLEVFTRLSNVELDFSRIEQQAEEMDERLTHLLERLNRESDEDDETGDEEFDIPSVDNPGEADEEGSSKPSLDAETRQRIERLFQQARQDRSKAHELKKELDRLGVFSQYEDRFLDLFKKAE
jgi:proteasome assembly chaperone (PAC2) family protein